MNEKLKSYLKKIDKKIKYYEKRQIYDELKLGFLLAYKDVKEQLTKILEEQENDK